MNSDITPSVLLVVEQLRRPVPGGIGTYARGLVAGLAEVEAANPDAPLSISLYASRLVPDPLEGLGRPVYTTWPRSPVLTRAWDRGIARAPVGFDVIHGVSLATPAKRRGDRAALVVMVHDLAWRSHPEATTPRGRRWHEAALGRALARADAFVVPSVGVGAELVAAGAPAAAVNVIAEGSDHLPPPDAVGATAILRASGVEGPYLLAVSTLEPRKNLRRLVDAYHRAQPEFAEPLPLVVAGPLGWGESGLADIERDGVVAVGHVEGAVLAALYAAATAFVYVPLAEGFGLPPVEAMVAGTPVVVSSAVPSVTESDGDPPALVVDPTDGEQIAAALVRVVSDRALGDALRGRGAAFVNSRTWRASAVAHLALWQSLA